MSENGKMCTVKHFQTNKFPIIKYLVCTERLSLVLLVYRCPTRNLITLLRNCVWLRSECRTYFAKLGQFAGVETLTMTGQFIAIPTAGSSYGVHCATCSLITLLVLLHPRWQQLSYCEAKFRSLGGLAGPSIAETSHREAPVS